MFIVEHAGVQGTIVGQDSVFLLDHCQLLEERGARRETFNTRTFNIFYRFMQLLSRNFAEQRSVNWYADQLQLTPKYLSQLIKNVSGRTVGQRVRCSF